MSATKLIHRIFLVTILLMSDFYLAEPKLQAPVNICIISDIHLMDASLGTSGTTFEAYLAMDRKMIAESEA